MTEVATLVFFGIKKDFAEDEIESVEERSHPLFVTARKAGLEIYWANIGIREPLYRVFVGRKLAVTGTDDVFDYSFAVDELIELSATVKTKLQEAGIAGAPSLFVQPLPNH